VLFAESLVNQLQKLPMHRSIYAFIKAVNNKHSRTANIFKEARMSRAMQGPGIKSFELSKHIVRPHQIDSLEYHVPC
jgi:hypothetical protein